MYKSILLLLLLITVRVYAQNAGDVVPSNKQIGDTSRQTDLIDIGKSLFHIGIDYAFSEGYNAIVLNLGEAF
jgi:hypothetical protein